jgi:hypothetical protein
MDSNHFVYAEIHVLAFRFCWSLCLVVFSLRGLCKMKNTNDVYVVIEGAKIGGVYSCRDDADSHAQAVGGNVVVQGVKNKIPVWVGTMLAAAKEKALMQNTGAKR